MSGFEIIILITIIGIGAAIIGGFLTRGQKSLAEITKDWYTNQEIQEEQPLPTTPYDKDIRPVFTPKEDFLERLTPPAGVPVEVGGVETVEVLDVPKPKKKRNYYNNKK